MIAHSDKRSSVAVGVAGPAGQGWPTPAVSVPQLTADGAGFLEWPTPGVSRVPVRLNRASTVLSGAALQRRRITLRGSRSPPLVSISRGVRSRLCGVSRGVESGGHRRTLRDNYLRPSTSRRFRFAREHRPVRRARTSRHSQGRLASPEKPLGFSIVLVIRSHQPRSLGEQS